MTNIGSLLNLGVGLNDLSLLKPIRINQPDWIFSERDHHELPIFGETNIGNVSNINDVYKFELRIVIKKDLDKLYEQNNDVSGERIDNNFQGFLKEWRSDGLFEALVRVGVGLRHPKVGDLIALDGKEAPINLTNGDFQGLGFLLP